MRRLVGKTNFDFMGKRRVGYLASALLVVGGLLAMGLSVKRNSAVLNLGIDFTGGTNVEVKFAEPPSVADVRDRLAQVGLGAAAIQEFGKAEEDELLIRVAEQTEETREIADMLRGAMYTQDEQERLQAGLVDVNNVGRGQIAATLAALDGRPGDPLAEEEFQGLAAAIVDYRTKHGGLVRSFDELQTLEGFADLDRQKLEEHFMLSDFTMLRVESVGPAVGKELKSKAFYAVVMAIIGILIYISLRFEFRFGLAAVLCLTHDVLVTVGAFALTNREVDLPVVAALLTIVGYSLNDTIVVFDRVRDNLKLMRKEKLSAIINSSVNEMLSRTLLTSLTTLFVVLSLYFLGGPVINGFAFALLIGVLVGTYSSVFVASAFLLEWTKWRSKGTAKV